MKTIILSAIALMSFSLIVAQETPVVLEDVTVSSKNARFLHLMQDENTPNHALELQSVAANYDLIRSRYYRGGAQNSYFIEFQTDNGSMYTTYNKKGAITKCHEEYNDIALPKAVRDEIFRDHPGWILDDTRYSTLYKNNDISKRIYKVKLKNGQNKKVVTIDLDQR